MSVEVYDSETGGNLITTLTPTNYWRFENPPTAISGYLSFLDVIANKGFDVNIVGVRNNDPSVADKVTNVFDDHLTVTFKDETGVHATSSIPVSFSVAQAPAPIPKPTPTKRPAPAPVDGCKNQVIN